MKQSDIMPLLAKGRPVVLGEFLRYGAEVITWTDKKTGRRTSGASQRFTVNAEEETFEVSGFIKEEEGKTPEQQVEEAKANWAKKPGFAKMQKVIVEIQSWQPVQGVVRCRGVVYPFENS